MGISNIGDVELWNSPQKTLEMQEKCLVSKKSDFIPQGYPQDNSTEESQPHWEEEG